MGGFREQTIMGEIGFGSELQFKHHVKTIF
jgi:hypothetical protein